MFRYLSGARLSPSRRSSKGGWSQILVIVHAELAAEGFCAPVAGDEVPESATR